MGVPYRVLEDLVAFNAAISDRFDFRTIALFCTDQTAESTVRFLRQSFDVVDALTGSEILAVTLEEPQGGYWKYLHERESTTEANSVHVLLSEMNRQVVSKGDISRESLPYRDFGPPPKSGELRELIIRLQLPVMDAPFLLLFDIPQRRRSIWHAHAYAMLSLNDAMFADRARGQAIIKAIFDSIYAKHASASEPAQSPPDKSDISSEYLERHLGNLPAGVHVVAPPSVTFSHFVAAYHTRTSADVKVVISLHGITTRGEWQKDLTPWMCLQGWIHMPLDYGYFPKSLIDIATFLRGRTREHLLQKLRKMYKDIIHDKALSRYSRHIVVIAHSFGTKIVADGLSRYGHLLNFERFIFCGSIVSADYNWGTHLVAGQVSGVLNEYGSLDFWTRTFSKVRGQPIAGVVGFTGSPPAVVNRQRQVTHSDWFNRLQFEHVWVPYLKTGLPPP
jgi:hypothetical protein